jgi:VWFA-related protein
MRSRFLSPVLALCLAATTVASHAQRPTFRSDVNIVRLDVSVLDKERLPIRGLTAADFTVLEDGNVQPISAFEAVDLPDWTQAGASWMRDVAPDVVTNRVAAQRVIVIVLDDVNVPLDPSAVRATKQIARAVIERMGPQDLAAVAYTFNRTNGQEFTTDRTRLLAAVERFTVSFGEQPSNPFSASERGRQSDPLADARARKPGPAVAVCPGGACVTNILRNAAEILREWPGGRKTMVLVSPGIRGFSIDALERAAQNADLRRTFAAMQEANINVYQFDPRGLQVASPVASDQFGVFADNTGGRAVTNTNAPWMLIPQVFRENSSYYLLGFRSTNARADGGFRRLTVRVTRPDLEVRTRSGYYAPRFTKTNALSSTPAISSLDAAIARGLPTGDLPMDLAVAPFAVPGKHTVALAIVAGMDRPAALSARGTLDVVATAFHDDWKPAGAWKQQLELAEMGSAGVGRHYDIASRLDLAPGRYEIRVAIDSRAAGRTGSAYASVTIPDFDKEPLELSGVVIEAGTTPGAVGPSPVASLMPIVPTTVREFAQSDRSGAFVRIYQGGKKPVVPVRLTVRMVNDTDRIEFDQSSTLGPESFGGLRSADYRFDLPLARLEPGPYLFTVEAVAGRQSVRRDVRLTIK